MTKFEGMMKRENPRNDFDNTIWNAGAELVVREETSENRVYDLEERTARFGEMIIDFAKTIPQNPVTNRIIGQLIGAGTSVGANYVEADDAVSKKEILKSIGLPERSPRNQAFSTHGGSSGAGVETASSNDLDGRKGTASDFLQNLEKWKAITKRNVRK